MINEQEEEIKMKTNDVTTWGKVDDYVTERLIPYDKVLEQVLLANREAGLPEIDVSWLRESC